MPLDQLSYLMRAMGYYPTEKEIGNMINEVKFSGQEGEEISNVDFNTFIRLFVNHRPVYGIGKGNIFRAFQALLFDDKSKKGVLSRSKNFNKFKLILS